MKPRWQSALADMRQVNPRAVLNAWLNYCEGLFRVAKPRSYPLQTGPRSDQSLQYALYLLHFVWRLGGAALDGL